MRKRDEFCSGAHDEAPVTVRASEMRLSDGVEADGGPVSVGASHMTLSDRTPGFEVRLSEWCRRAAPPCP